MKRLINKVYTLSEINDLAVKNPEKLIEMSEKNFKNQVKKIVDYIVYKKNKCKLILITGPSSSGKTTFSKILRNELRKLKIWNDTISLDNFYKKLYDVPLLADGTKDFETIDSLKVEEIKKALSDLLENGKCDIPIYDFKQMAVTDKRVHIEVPFDGIIIVEGLHAINPKITENLPKNNILKIYIDVSSSIKVDDKGETIRGESIRLMRRIERDYKYRYTLPIKTIMMWKNVRRGEEIYIRPLKKCADFVIDTFHIYEPCIIGNDVMSYLVSSKISFNIEKLVHQLRLFKHIDKKLVPEDSLIREFI